MPSKTVVKKSLIKKPIIKKGKQKSKLLINQKQDEKMPFIMKSVIVMLTVISVCLAVYILYKIGQKSAVKERGDIIEKQKETTIKEDSLFDSESNEIINEYTPNTEEDVVRNHENNSRVSDDAINSLEDILVEDVNSGFFEEEAEKLEIELNAISSEYDALEGMNNTLRSWFPFP